MHPGTRLGVYELVEELGKGGMGVVWRAHDERLGRDVALKILPPDLADDPEALVRFEREARGLAALSHPNIVSIFDLGHEGGLRYIVTELLDGETLLDLLRRGPLDPQRAVEICATIGSGLAAAHAKGILHRDLKPENIFLTHDGRVKILDFGLAKEVGWAKANATTMAKRTEPGRIMGTLGFTSPEQLRGEDADFTSDIFSLGCVLYEMIAGRPAFQRFSAAETIAAILSEEPPPLVEAPADLARIVRQCIEKTPQARFQTANDLVRALQHARTADAPDLQRGKRIGRRMTRGRFMIAALIALAVLTAGAFALLRDSGRVPAAVATESVSLAVVPFAADGELAYASEGLAESLFRRLAPLESIQAVARKSHPDEPFSAASLGANHLLHGTIRSDGDNVSIHSNVVRLSDRSVVWHGTYRGAPGDLLHLQGRLGGDVERFLRSYAKAEPARAPLPAMTVDPHAYREYLKGRHYWNKFTLESFHQALEHFQKSIDHDASYALAYAGLADTYTMLAFHGGNSEEWMPRARAAATRATALAPQLGEAFTSLGTVLLLYDWQWDAAGEALQRGVELNPRYATAHHAWAIYLGVVGRLDEALREIETASVLDPLSMVIDVDLAWIHYTRGDTAKAIAVSERTVRHNPRSPLPYSELVWYLEHAGRWSEAIDAFEAALRLEEKDIAPAMRLRDALQRNGEAGYLRAKLRMAEEQTTRSAMLARLGEPEAAITALEEGYRRRERDILYLKTSPTYDTLRGHPRFERLLQEIGF